MKPANLIFAGTILKTHGFEGAVVVKAEPWLEDRITEDEPVFLEVEGKPVPFFPLWTEGAGTTLIIKFDGYDSPDDVKEFAGCKIQVASLPQGANTTLFSPEELKGFTVKSEDGSVEALITGFIDTRFQYILQAEYNGKEILIPFHEDLIVSVEMERRVLVLHIPDGLTDLNI